MLLLKSPQYRLVGTDSAIYSSLMDHNIVYFKKTVLELVVIFISACERT